TQRKWERHGDPNCWRREHDLYDANVIIPNQIKLPCCLLLEEEADLTRIWMEYVEGVTGKHLDAEDLVLTAERLGSFQADYHLRGRRDLSLLRGYPAVGSSFDLWWNNVKEPLRDTIEGFPDELRQILNGYAEQANELLNLLEALPVTLCQGDVHQGNIILRKDSGTTSVYLIDWDCAGYGRMGEDAIDLLIEAFVYSDWDVSMLPGLRRGIMDSYCQGAKLQGVDFDLGDKLVRDVFVLAWGFRIVSIYLYGQNECPKERYVQILYAMLT
ncbi:aminoglycoside phosphotransferase family protein, partial [Megasphaera massiliensis]